MTNHATTSSSSKSKAGSASTKTMTGLASEPKRDICQEVTDRLVAALEAGVKPWAKSWTSKGGEGATMPLRHNGERYRGINVLLLWGAQLDAGYASAYWMTYRQAMELGGQVRKGEKATPVVFYGTAGKDEGAGESGNDQQGGRVFRFLKQFSVFNADQIDGLPERYQVKAEAPTAAQVAERLPEIEAVFAATGADIRHGGNRAFYRPSTDHIQMPHIEQFRDPAYYYATLSHELVHWTKKASRCDRDFGSTAWGDEGYAKEELVAEIGAAFLSAEFGFPPEHVEDHASYIASWLKQLRDDKRLIFMAAAKAQAAVDFIMDKRQVQELAEAA